MIIPFTVLKVVLVVYVVNQYTRNIIDLVTDKQVSFTHWLNKAFIIVNLVVASGLLYVIYQMRLF